VKGLESESLTEATFGDVADIADFDIRTQGPVINLALNFVYPPVRLLDHDIVGAIDEEEIIDRATGQHRAAVVVEYLELRIRVAWIDGSVDRIVKLYAKRLDPLGKSIAGQLYDEILGGRPIGKEFYLNILIERRIGPAGTIPSKHGEVGGGGRFSGYA
jgi:hypothetical protein